MAMGKHYGSFGKGFADALIAMMKMSYMRDYYESRKNYYDARAVAYGQPKPGSKAALEAEANRARVDAEGRPLSGYALHGGADGGGGGGGGGVSGNAGELKNFYISQGYTPEGASAIVGNWQQENSLRGGGWGGDKGTSAGGFQWHDDPAKGLYRGTAFMSWAADNHLDVNDPMTSARYSVVDLKQNYPALDKYLRSTNDVDEATQKFERDFEGAGLPAMKNRLAAARTVYSATPDTAKPIKVGTEKTKVGPTGGPDVKVNGKTYHTDADGRIIDEAKPSQAQADLPTNQLAGGTDEEAMRIALEENKKLSAIPPTPVTFDPNKPQQTDLGPPMRDRQRISAIPQGETVPAQDTPFKVPPESGFPYEPYNERGPENVGTTTARDWRETDQPRLPPVQDRELGPENVGPSGAPPNVGITPSSVRPQQGPPQRTGAPPNVGPTPSAIPQGPEWRNMPAPPNRPVMGPPQRTGAPPNVNITPSSVPDAPPAQMGPEGPGRTELPATATPIGGGEGNKLEAPTGTPAASDADKPAPNAQNAGPLMHSTVTPQSNQPGGRFITMERPNLDQAGGGRSGGARQQSQMGMLNLSGLFGPNPPLPRSAPAGGTQTPVPSGQIAPPPGGGPTPYPGPTMNPSGRLGLTGGNATPGEIRSVATPMPPIRPPDMDLVDAGVAAGAAKGGPIQRFANGGIPSKPTTAFYGGGSGAVAAPSYSPAGGSSVPYATYDANPAPAMGKFNAGAYADPGYQLWRGGAQWLGSQPTSPYSAQAAEMTPGGVQANIDALPTNLQTWYNQQNADAMAGGGGGSGNEWYYNPDSIPAAPSPATAAPTPAAAGPTIINPPSVQNITNMPASTTVTDPTTTTTTGAPGLPNAITAKSYDPNVDATTGAGFANTSNAGGTNYSVGKGDKLKQNSQGQISGADQTILSAKGGGIPARPTMRFADAGSVAFTPVGYQGSRTQGEQYLYSPQYVGPTLQGGWTGTPYDQLAPNQQAWADATKGLMGQWSQQAGQNYAAGSAGKPAPNAGPGPEGQITVMPSAIWPAAPSAPTPLNEPPPSASTVTAPITDTATIDPTTTTTTGTPGIPNIITAKSYDPNVDATTGAGFANTSNAGGVNYSVGADDTLKQNSQGQISGTQNQNNTTILSAKGGPISRRRRTPPRKNYTRYDLGGGVGDQSGDVSPSALGMPPGLASGGGQQQIPPYYYNPATYSGFGAPVGKGVTQTSVPTFTAGAIPSLPMARGGMVYKFDDGGDVPDESASMMPSPIMDEMSDQRDEAEDAQREQADAQAAAAPGAGAGAYDQGGKYFVPPDDTAQPVTPASDQSQPQGHGPYRRTDNLTPQIKDDQGNPSRGLIDAISGGLQWMAAHLGLGSAQAAGIAGDPQTQTARMNVAQGKQPDGDDVISHAAYHDANDTQDPGNALNAYEHKIGGMEGVRLWMLHRGDVVGANKMGASQMQFSAAVNAPLGEEAAKRYYDGNLKGAMDALNEADNNVVDGRHITFRFTADGKGIEAVGSDLNARELWKQRVAPHAILAAAVGYHDQSATWKRYEDMAVRYDPAMKAEYDARIAEQKQDAKDQAAAAAAQKFGEEPIAPQGGAPAPAAPTPTAPASPTLTPVSTPALPGPGAAPSSPETAATAPSPGRSPDTTTAQQASPPPAADSNAAPSGQAQPVSGEQPAIDFDKIAASLDRDEDVGRQQVVLNANEQFKSQYQPPPDQRKITTTADQIAYKEAVARVNAYNKGIDIEKGKYIEAGQKAISDRINAKRADLTQARSDIRQQRGFTEQEKLRTQSETAADTRATTQKQNEWTHIENEPLKPEEMTARFKERSPTAYLAASPATAAYKSDGSFDENTSAQNLGKMFDLDDRGGLERISTLSSALYNIQAYNKHLGQDQLGVMVTNMANGKFGYRAKPQPVDNGFGELRQVEVYRGKVGQGTPIRLLVPVADYDAINGVNDAYMAAHKPPTTTDGASLPPPPAPAPAPTGSTTVRPPVSLLQQQPAIPNQPQAPRPLPFQVPQRVPAEQVPPDWRSQFPELNQ